MANRISVFVWNIDCDVHVLSQIIMYLKRQPCFIPYISAHTIMSLSQRKKKLKKVMRQCYPDISGGGIVAQLCFFEFDTILKLNHNYEHDSLSSSDLGFLEVMSMITSPPPQNCGGEREVIFWYLHRSSKWSNSFQFNLHFDSQEQTLNMCKQ